MLSWVYNRYSNGLNINFKKGEVDNRANVTICVKCKMEIAIG